MLAVTFIIAIIALFISILAYRRAGGAKELRKTVDSLSSTMESLKDRTGDSLKEQVEKLTSVTESLKERTAVKRISLDFPMLQTLEETFSIYLSLL